MQKFNCCQKNVDAHHIDGMILVGSGAEGFTDKWSDIDLSIVVCEEEKTRQVWDRINEKIISNFDLIKISYKKLQSILGILMIRTGSFSKGSKEPSLKK